MRRSVVVLAILLVSLSTVQCLAQSGPTPTRIDRIDLDRGRDISADGTVTYHQGAAIWVTDPDGIGDIASVTVVDSVGGVYMITAPPEPTDWWEVRDAFTITVYWAEMDMLAAPPPGPYTLIATDLVGNKDTIVTASTPPVADLGPVLLSPANNSLVYDTLPVFTWAPSVPEAHNNALYVWDEATGDVWNVDMGTETSAVYNFDGNASLPELVPGHTYGWFICSWSCDDCGTSDPRVNIVSAPYTFGRFTIYSSNPAINAVGVCPGRDTDAPDWAKYHDRVYVRVTDLEGAAHVSSVTIIDAGGTEHTVTPTEGGWWGQDGDYAIVCGWCASDLPTPPSSAPYTIMVTDASSNTDTLVTPTVPVASDAHPETVTPVMDSVIYDASPVFEWNAGLAGSWYGLHLEEEGSGEIWFADVGEPVDPVIQVPYEGELQPNHSYFWSIDAWRPEDVFASDPRVEIWTSQWTRARFTLYGDWPETPPTLPGKIVYNAGAGVVGYSTDPHTRVWLGPDGSWIPAWSPDGTTLLYGKADRLWIDRLDGGGPAQIPGISGGNGRWAPDGERICYSRRIGDEEWDSEIRVANTDGLDDHLVSPPGMQAMQPAWSPDGSWISFRTTDGTWLVRPDGSQAHRMEVTGIAGYPGYATRGLAEHSWSPDGTKLAGWVVANVPENSPYPCWPSPVYSQWPGGCLAAGWINAIGIVSRDGGAITPVFVAPDEIGCCSAPHWPAWSPDGSKIIFSSGHHLGDQAKHTESEPGTELWMVNADGSGGLTRLTYDYSEDGCASWWAPNTITGLSKSWTVVDVTVTFEEVTSDGSTSIVVSAPPAPAPEPLAFVGDHIYHIATTAGISGDVTIAVDYSDTNYPPVLGERLSLLLWDGAQWIDITTSTDTAAYTITGHFTPGAERDWIVALALDKPPVPKAKVMFEGCTEGRPGGPGLFVANADLTDPVRITLPAPSTASPECYCGGCGHIAATWSPDGTKVAMVRADGGKWHLQVLDLRTLVQEPGQEPGFLLDELGEQLEAGMMAWSPSGDRIVYHGPGPREIGIVNADGTGRHAIYTFPESNDDWARISYPDWSPDGTRIVFGLEQVVRLDGHLYLLEKLDDPGGATLRQLTTDDRYNDEAAHWSPDGTRVAFTRSPRGVGIVGGSDIYVIDVNTGTETQVTHTPGIGEIAEGWCEYDGYIYVAHPNLFLEGEYPPSVKRILPDGSGEEVLNAQISPVTWTLERWSWMPTGVWMDGLNALPGETVTAKMGVADAEDLAGVQAKVLYDGLGMHSAELGGSILDWVMPSPVMQPGKASLLAYASDPENQSIWGPAHLFDLNMLNPPSALPGESRLMSFDSLLLSDEWGEPLERVTLNGGVHTIPFAKVQVSSIAGPIGADPLDPMPIQVTLTALDWQGWTMPECDVAASLWASWNETHNTLRPVLRPVTPASAVIVDGAWAGQVSLSEPRPSVRLLASWEDYGGYSNWFQAIGKGDINASDQVNIFDVVKIANIAIGRGTWASWQLWAADLNGDHEVNIFDVVQCANKAMEAMGTLSFARAAVAATSTGPVTVSATTTSVGAQTIVTVELSDCAGLAGGQVELAYDARKLSYVSMSKGALLTGTGWSALDNDLGGTVKAIAYTATGQILPVGKGSILTFTFNRTGKGTAKVELTAVKLADADGSEIKTATDRGRRR